MLISKLDNYNLLLVAKFRNQNQNLISFLVDNENDDLQSQTHSNGIFDVLQERASLIVLY